jgi:hypothetical protein
VVSIAESGKSGSRGIHLDAVIAAAHDTLAAPARVTS